MDVPQAHESVDSRSNMAGGRQAEVAQMEAELAATGNGFAQLVEQFATETAAMPGELLLPLLPGDRTAPHRHHASVQGSFQDPPGDGRHQHAPAGGRRHAANVCYRAVARRFEVRLGPVSSS
jgi:hypothetical protein